MYPHTTNKKQPQTSNNTTHPKSDTAVCIRTEQLSEKPFDSILGYPGGLTRRDLDNHIEDLIRMGIISVSFTGPVCIGRLRVLGKGFAGVVLYAHTAFGDAALKIRRTDSPRETMSHEATLLRISNGVGVGPQLLAYSDNSILMEWIAGPNIQRWLQNTPDKKAFRDTIRHILHDCFKLDQAKLDHGELVDASHHIIISHRPTIVDFDSASTSRRASNITSVTQYLFVLGRMSRLVGTIHKTPPTSDVINTLRSYKQNTNNTSYTNLLRTLGLYGGTGEIRTHDL